MRAQRVLLLIGLMTFLVRDTGRAQEEASPVAAVVGQSRADPVPLGASVLAGPVVLQVLEMLRGPEAVNAILAASPSNSEPRDGMTYVAVRLAVRNAGDQPLWLDNDDFALTGSSGLVRRFLGAQPPDPALDVTLGPGEVGEGWVAFGVPADEASLLLLFDSLDLGGTWADRVLALEDGAAIPDVRDPAAATNDAGTDPLAPIGAGETAVTAQWSVALLDVVTGVAAFDLVDYRTGALGSGDAAGEDGSLWVALRFHVQNVAAGGEVDSFPVSAFTLVDEEGNPLPDVATLTPPWPDLGGDYYPGAEREGWVMFDVPLDFATATVRFLPYAQVTASPDPRYFTFQIG